jgi:hypothetical protein
MKTVSANHQKDSSTPLRSARNDFFLKVLLRIHYAQRNTPRLPHSGGGARAFIF